VHLIKSMGDRLLALFVSEIKAGACVPEHGQVCAVLHYQRNGVCR
jgi:hypothetical protein